MLKLVPNALREAAFALGTPKWKVVAAITLKASIGGIMTGVLLAIARIAGETAPLLFTALSNQFFSLNLSEPIANLPVTIYKFALSPYPHWQQFSLRGPGVFLDHGRRTGTKNISGARNFFRRNERRHKIELRSQVVSAT